MKWCFVPLQAGKPWTGATIHTEALGGSEAAVAYTARALAKAGEDVWVVTHGAPNGQPSLYDNVKYVNGNAMGIVFSQEWDVVVISRWFDALNAPWKTKVKLFWIHDLRDPSVPNISKISANAVVCISEFQQTTWGFKPGQSAIIGNGVDLDLFKPFIGTERDPNKIIWSSNPDRGLPLAMRIFQKVRERWPDLVLHVYGRSAVYGWGPDVEAAYLFQDDSLYENVILHDPLPRFALARELSEAWAWFYPTWWPETYCMAALEVQAAGCPIICSPYAALNETVKGGVLTYDFLNAFSQLRNKRRWEKLSQAGRTWAAENSWDASATKWKLLAEQIHG